MKDFRSLKIWQRSHAMALAVYKLTREFPKHELYGLTSQIQRAAISVPTNIAEGCGRDSDAELKRFSVIAMGSASELEYLLLLAHDLGYLQTDMYQSTFSELVETRRMINSFIQTLKANS